jgi:signal transduction histidine kinase
LLVVKNRASLALEGGGADAMRDQLRQISDIVGDAIRETRAIAQNLRPVQLDRLGLAAALRAAVERAAQGSGIRFTVDVEGGDEALPREAEINLFRAVQEGVNNILKHSGATEATVLLHREDRALRVVVSDNGRGLGAAAAGRGVGMGLSGIAERVRLLGGRHEIETAPGEGTTHRIVIPL